MAESLVPPVWDRFAWAKGGRMIASGGIGIVGIIVVVLIVLAIVYFVRRS